MEQPLPGQARRWSRPYYGWVIVAALGVAGGASMFMGVGNFGIFVAPMSEDLGLGNSAFGWALSARLFGFALSGPFIGRLLDSRGSRVPLAVGGIMLGGACVAMSLIEAGWQMIGLALFSGMMGFWGSSTLFLTIPIAKWFVSKRGRAMSVFFPAIPFGIGISSPLTQMLVDAVGWRDAWFILGIAGGIAIAAVSLVFVRNKPSDLGLLPDGESIELGASEHARTSRIAEYSWTVRQSMRTGTFWRISAAYGILMAVMGTIGVFWVAFLLSLGIPPQVSAIAFAVQAFTQVASAIAIAPWVDRVQPRYVAMAGFTCIAAAMLVAAGASTAWHGFAGAALAGLGLGGGMLSQTHIWPAYYGRDHIGAVRGAATPITLTLTGIGTPILGILFDVTGFTIGWIAAAGALSVGVVLLALSPKPRAPQ
ncbi:MAG: MFS transporter [Chloroflexi bacterium]|nr:MFS transporter [Chloroflexota bacterium]MYA49616.1 MFS transporter [Chloroflexota bacterium]MYB84209.1 MFS transporter [Chloroflexota bacterium]MYF65208.1 MFS transporter [Chloroflexota bacterium]MYK33655.1 MFS transporter [Chloroflexota bacterium]